MRFAYADPPYIGQAKKHYGREEVDHAVLLERLVDDYPDGWALSCSSPSLDEILYQCRCLAAAAVRVGAWVKPFASFKPGVNPGYCWEPVIFSGGRKRGREMPTLRDWVSCNITLKKGLSGAKPEPVVEWIADWLNMQPGDTVDDLYPGTGICGAVFARRLAA